MSRSKHNPTASIDQLSSDSNRSLQTSVLLGIVQSLTVIGFAWLVATLIDKLLSDSLEKSDLPILLTILALILAVRHLTGYLQSRINLKRSVLIRDRLREHILNLSFQRGIRLTSSFKPAEMANLLTSEVEGLKDYLAEYQVQKKLAVITPVLILIASLTVNWLVPLILLLTTPLIPIFMILVGKKAAEASRKNMTEMNRLGTLLEDRLRNIELLQRNRAVEPESEQLYQQSDRFRRSTLGVLKLAFLSGTLLEFFAAVSVALVAVYLGLFFLGKYSLGSWGDTLSFAQGAFLLMLAPEYYLPLRKLGALYHAKSNARATAEQVEHLESLIKQQEEHIGTQTINDFNSIVLKQIQSGEPSRPAHKAISLALNSGDSLLIEAPSGTGKTTLLDSLAGLRPIAQGSVQIDGESTDIYANPNWQSKIGYISQHPELVYGSIRENLCLGHQYTDQELWAALERAELKATVEALPSQLEHYITDSGAQMSGGQIQRLAIARIFLHRPKLLLLDEPIANLDQDTADQFMAGLRFHTEQGGILIMASHRLSTHFNFTQTIELQPHRGGSDD